MGNYFVKAGEEAGTWCILCRPKYEKAPYLVEEFSSEADALKEAAKLNGVNSQYFHFPWGERLKLFAVCKSGGLYEGWKPVSINLFEQDARELVASLNNEQLAMIPHSTINLAEGTFLNHRPAENRDNAFPKHTGCPTSFFPSFPVAPLLKCKDCNIDLEAGNIVPFAECCIRSKDAPETSKCAHCGKPLGAGEGTHYERGLLCDECPEKVIDAFIVVHKNKFLAAGSFLELAQLVHEKFGEKTPKRLSFYRHPKTVDALYSISKDWERFQEEAA